MKINDLLVSYCNRDTGHKREIGKYWASEVYAIVKGYIKPADYLKNNHKDLKAAQMILTGIAFEDMLTKILEELKIPFQKQVRTEIKIDDEIVLVVKPDFVFDTYQLETKFPFAECNGIPDRYAYQLECEYQALKLPTFLGKFRVPFDVEAYRYEPSITRWQEIQQALKSFHNKVKKLCK